MNDDSADDVYGDRWIRYGTETRAKDRKATPAKMRNTARIYRRRAEGEVISHRPRLVDLADAAYCESLAERKEKERESVE